MHDKLFDFCPKGKKAAGTVNTLNSNYPYTQQHNGVQRVCVCYWCNTNHLLSLKLWEMSVKTPHTNCLSEQHKKKSSKLSIKKTKLSKKYYQFFFLALFKHQ